MTEPAFHYLFQAEKSKEKLSSRRKPSGLKLRWKCEADVKLNEKLGQKFTVKTWRTNGRSEAAHLSYFHGTCTVTP